MNEALFYGIKIKPYETVSDASIPLLKQQVQSEEDEQIYKQHADVFNPLKDRILNDILQAIKKKSSLYLVVLPSANEMKDIKDKLWATLPPSVTPPRLESHVPSSNVTLSDSPTQVALRKHYHVFLRYLKENQGLTVQCKKDSYYLIVKTSWTEGSQIPPQVVAEIQHQYQTDCSTGKDRTRHEHKHMWDSYVFSLQ